ncbi:hypothetical protein [Micromonospora sp. NPDC005299]|uniref:maleate cis-trans isomerase family protein n=1 Tax=Micromonospora sp. NPDC005299 TaxID=3364231 RepID=UPI0036ACEF96
MSIGFGTRARVGHIYPSGGICDYEIQMMAPDGIHFLTTRLPFSRTGLDDDRAMTAGIEQAAALLSHAEADMIAFNCTAASMLVGADEVRARVGAATGGIPCVSTIEAVIQALGYIGATRIALLDPYPTEVEEAEIAYLAGQGFEVVDHAGPACSTPIEQGIIPPEEWIAIASRVDASAADAVLVSCAGTQTARAISGIEELTGLPVVTSNQALLWLVLRTLRIHEPLPNYGRLLSSARP